MSQNSPTLDLEKTENALAISSTNTNELCHVCVVFERPFFAEWDDHAKGPFEVDAKTLHNVSNAMQTKSVIKIAIYDKKICFEITDHLLKRITLSNIAKANNIFKPIENHGTETKLVLKSETFLSTVRELANFLDEAQLLIKKGTNQIFFSGKRTGVTVEMRPEVTSALSVFNDICIEFPIKFFQPLLPLLKNFEEIVLISAPETPLILEGTNDKWHLSFVISKIDKLCSK